MEWYHLTSTFASNEFLHFDKSIRDWVVIPMFILLIIVGMGRQYLSILIKNTPKVTAKELEKEFRQKQVIAYSSRLRSHGNSISNTSYQRKKLYLLHKENGLLQEKISTVPTSPLSNPNAMMDMMKGNLIFMIPNIAMMTFVSYFFSGFLCLKLPFQLPSNKFKLMLQRGIDIVDLDVTYVSALSWYFIVTFGLNGIYRMLMSDGMEMNDQAQMMNMQMGMVGAGQPPMFDAAAAFRQEQDLLNIHKHEFIGDRIERDLLGDQYPTPFSANEIDLSSLN